VLCRLTFVHLFEIEFKISLRVLYNLEVLSGKLLPTKVEAAPKFSNDFLEAGGLRVILDVFQHDALPIDVNCDIRQSIYLVGSLLFYDSY
jgi:hypothetical protein